MRNLKHGILALSKHDYPRAFLAFRQVYTSAKWQSRDVAVTALGDLFDPRILEARKPPNSSLLTGCYAPRASATLLSAQRLLVLQENFIHPSLCQVRNLVEHRTLLALRATQKFMEQVLLNDPEYLVRFSSLVILKDYFPNERRYVILPTFQQALKRESNPDLKVLLEHFLATTVQ